MTIVPFSWGQWFWGKNESNQKKVKIRCLARKGALSLFVPRHPPGDALSHKSRTHRVQEFPGPSSLHRTPEPTGFSGSGCTRWVSLGSGVQWIKGPRVKGSAPSGFWFAAAGFWGQFGAGVLGKGAGGGRAPTGSGTEAPRTIFLFFQKSKDTLTQRVHSHPLTRKLKSAVHSQPLWNKATLIS